MLRGSIIVLGALWLTACNGSDDYEYSTPTEPTVEFDVPVPEVDTDWPDTDE